MMQKIKFVAMILLWAAACGRPEDDASDYTRGSLPRALPERLASVDWPYRVMADTSGVSMTKCSSGTGSVDPSAVPEDAIPKITLKFCVKLDAGSSTTFAESAKSGYWGVKIIGKDNTSYVATTDGSLLKLLNKPTVSNGSANGTVEMAFNFTGETSKTELVKWIVEANSRKTITFRPLFWIGDAATSPTTDPTKIVIPSDDSADVVMKTDIGIFANPLSVTASAKDQTMVVSWTLSDKSSVNYTNSKPEATGENSSHRSTVVMIWNEEECAAKGTWDFVTNEAISELSNVAQQKLSCTYPTTIKVGDECVLTEGSCPGEDGKIATEDPQNIAVPAEIPGVGGKFKKVGCYRVYHTDNNSVSATDLKNNSSYGVFAWPVDGNGKLGKQRSTCVFDTPAVRLPPSARKGTPLSKDCFVATAASGDTNSSAVFYWRVIRDLYLEGTAFKHWYMQNGPTMASWLDAHDQFKPMLNSVLALSGWAIVEGRLNIKSIRAELLHKAFEWKRTILEFLVPAAKAADEPSSQPSETALPTPAAEPTATPTSTPAPTPTVAPAAAATPLPTPTPVRAAPVVTPTPTATPTQVPTPNPVATPLPTTATQTEVSLALQPWNGSSWTNINFSGGIIMTSKDKEIYKAYYKSKPPTRFMLSQSFRLFDASGEFGLGYGFSYTSIGGNFPKKDPVTGEDNPKNVVGEPLGFYSLGGYGVLEYRYRHSVDPYLWPRLTILGGVERFREEQLKPDDFIETEDSPWEPRGVTVTAPVIIVRLSVEVAVGQLGLGDNQALRDGYGANEFALTLYGEYINDLSSKRTSLSGLGAGAGLSLLLP